jgi:cytochrome c biogenesis protein CcmG/thiol:disulfide interchange protein DsbE
MPTGTTGGEAAVPQVGSQAPDFSLTTLDGRALSLSDFRGQVVLLNFWATRCVPCRAEMPALQAAYQTYGDQNFVILSINEKEDDSAVAPFAETFQLTMPVMLDRDGSAARRYRVRGLPMSFLVDPEGVIREVKAGEMNLAYIESRLAALGTLAVRESITPVPTAPAPASDLTQRLDIEEIFPPGEGQDLALKTCLVCHSVLTFGYVRKTSGGWLTNQEKHTQKFFARLSAETRPNDAEVETMYDYLVANFQLGRPLSKQLPPGFVCDA